jgi:copper chaperone
MPDSVTFSVPDMSCGHCVKSVDEALRKQPGVTRVLVDLEAKTARVDGEDLQVAALGAALDAIGFPAEPRT